MVEVSRPNARELCVLASNAVPTVTEFALVVVRGLELCFPKLLQVQATPRACQWPRRSERLGGFCGRPTGVVVFD